MSDWKNIFLTGKCMFAMVQKPGTDFNGNEIFKLDLLVDKEQLKLLEPRHPLSKMAVHGGEEYVKLKRKVKNSKGEDNEPLLVVGPDKRPFKELVGNGSKIKVKLLAKEVMQGNGKPFLWTQLEAVQVLDHVPYDSDKGDDFVVDRLEGFDVEVGEEDFA